MTIEYRHFPGTAVRVSDLCLGTMTWGRGTAAADAHAQLDIAVAHGINFIDTAEAYPVPASPQDAGATERILGDCPLAGGVLTGKYAHGQRPAGSRFEVDRGFADRWIAPRALRAAEAYAALAVERGWAPEQLALAFVRQQWFVTTAIVGATASAMLENNLRGATLRLDAEALRRIDAIRHD